MVKRIIQRIVENEPEHPSLPVMRRAVVRLGDRIRELEEWKRDYRKRNWKQTGKLA